MGGWRGPGLLLVGLLGGSRVVAPAGGAGFAVWIGWGGPGGIGIVVIGALLVLLAFRGGIRWLILPVMALAIGASVASAADLDFRGGLGDREYRPLSAAAIPADGYRLGVGQLVVDLRGLDWERAHVVHLDVDLGAGQANVLVPSKVCVAGSGHVGAGEAEIAG